MRKVHRFLAAMLLTAAIVLTGCSAKQEDITGKVTPNDAPGATVPRGSVETLATGTTPVQTTEPVPEETGEDSVALGRMEGGVYTNTYAGFGCELNSDWVFYSAEELQELPGNVQELLADTDMGESLAQLSQITDMMAENENDLMTMNVLYTKLGTQERLLYAMMSEEEILDAALSSEKDTLITTYAQAGVDISSLEKTEVEFLGQTHYALKTVGSMSGIPIYMIQLFDYHAGRYSITTTLMSYLDDRTEEMLKLFYKVD